MIKKEYETWLLLGGNITTSQIITALEDEIKACISYTSCTNEEKVKVLQRVTVETLAFDYIRVITSIVKAKQALKDNNASKAQKILQNLFR